MARGKSTQSNKPRNLVYLQCDLTKEHKRDLVKWVESGVDLWDMLEKAIDSELRFGCGYDAYNDCTQASLTQITTDKGEQKTVVLVGRGPDLVKAMQSLFFKYHNILQGKMDDGDLKNQRGVTDWS